MDTTIIAAIIGVLGLFLGSVLNGVGYFLSERYKKIRIINQTLFYLFKVLHLTMALKNLNKMVVLYINKLKEHPDTKKMVTNDDKILSQLCNEFLSPLIKPISDKVNNEFQQKYNESIFELSSVNPVAAYELSKTS
jgi:hypothetical protein